MLVSFDWLKQYVATDLSTEEVAQRLMFAGLNDDGVTTVGGDACLNLEVTSNRPDCLGTIGIAREAAVLLDLPLSLPAASPVAHGKPVDQWASVALECPALCPRYTARVITGVKVASSPGWLVKRLATIGIAAINNVVDITNYVLMECGQPLHAFDLAKLAGRKVIVRTAAANEKFLAINHKEYTLDKTMCVIADAKRPVALGGVMGGADTEVSPGTTELLIEAAEFDPLSIRSTARKLALHSDSSHRFERLLDPEGVDWASRRCCELILELAGGELAQGMLDVGRQPAPRQPIVLRFPQLKRILGIEVPTDEARRILTALGNRELQADARRVEVVPPSWRRDLEREIDLVEEVARVHGYDKIPEDANVPMFPSHRTDEDRLLSRCRQVLTAAGLDEALTLSAVEEPLSEAFSPWTASAPLSASMPVLRRADRLRRSLIPSLLAARRLNESQANPIIELFEIAKVYLPSGKPGELPCEPRMLAITSGSDFRTVKGILEALVGDFNRQATLAASTVQQEIFGKGPACTLHICANGRQPVLLGYLGTVCPTALKQFELRAPTTVAEISLSVLLEFANLIPQYAPLPTQPAISRDLNFVVAEAVRWADLARTVQTAAGPEAEALQFVGEYRDEKKLGSGVKSLLMSVRLRRPDATLTSEQADAIRERIVAAVKERHAGSLRA